MALVFREVHAAPDKKHVNEEWFVLENTGASSISTAGLQVFVAHGGKRASRMGAIDPGFMLKAGEKILVVSGIPGKKSQGEPPVREGMRTYHLFLREGLLRGAGTSVRLVFNQVDVVRVTYDVAAPDGVGTVAA